MRQPPALTLLLPGLPLLRLLGLLLNTPPSILAERRSLAHLDEATGQLVQPRLVLAPDTGHRCTLSIRSGAATVIEDAVKWRVLDQTMAEARAGFADLPSDAIEALADEAVAAVRQDRKMPSPKAR